MNQNSPGIKSLISELNKKTQEISTLQEAIKKIQEDKGIEQIETAKTFLEKKLLETQKSIKEKEIKKEQKYRNQYLECLEMKAKEIKCIIENIKEEGIKILVTCENAIKYIEENYAKLKLIYQIPINIAIELTKGDVKLNMALDLVRMVLDTIFDSELIKNTINYLCGVIFPKTIEGNNNIQESKKKSRIKKWISTIKTDIR